MHRSSNGSKRPSPTTASNPIAKKSCQKPFQAMRIVVGKISPKPLQDKVRFFTTLKDDDTKDPIVDRFVQKQAKIEAPVIELTPASEFPQIDDGVRINMLTPLPHYHCKGLYDNCLDTEPHWNRFLVQGPFANASANATPGLINLTTFEKKVFKATVEDVTTAECASAMTNCAIFGRVSNHSMPATPPKTGNYRLLSSPSGMIVPVDVKLVSGEYALTDFSESTKLLGMGIFNPRGMSFYRDICRVSNNVNVGDVRFLSPRAILLRGNIVVLRSPLEHVSDPYNSGNDAQMFLNNDLPTYYDPLYDGWSDDEKPFAAEAKITSQAMCEQSQIHSKLIYDAFAEAFNHIGSVLSSKPKQTAISAIVVAGMFPAFFNGLSSHYNMIRNALIATSSLVLSPRFRLFLQPDVSCTKLTAMGMFPVPPNPAIHWMNNIDTVQKSLADKPIATVEVIVDNPAMYIADYGCASKVCVVSASEFTKNTTLHHLASQRSFYISRDPTANQGAVANYTDNSGFPAPWTLPTDPAWSPDYVIVVGDVAKPIIASSEKGANEMDIDTASETPKSPISSPQPQETQPTKHLVLDIAPEAKKRRVLDDYKECCKKVKAVESKLAAKLQRLNAVLDAIKKDKPSWPRLLPCMCDGTVKDCMGCEVFIDTAENMMDWYYEIAGGELEDERSMSSSSSSSEAEETDADDPDYTE